MQQITLTQPDDWHLHVRTGDMLKTVINHTVRQFARAIIMPNLQPPVTNVAQALIYQQEILHAASSQYNFNPLMVLYLTNSTTVEDVRLAADSSAIHAFKLYPAGATTNSAQGITDLKAVFPIFAAMEEHNVPLLVHGEVTDADIDIFDRERVFIEQKLSVIHLHFPTLRIVLEHVTTREAVQFVQQAPDNIAATITPQHLLYNRNAILVGGIKPHYYCLPILKRETHREALVKAATSGNPKFFLGTDSAPHLSHLKENSCGCAGCYSAYAAIELYAEAFDAASALDKLEGFASFYGADFYQLPRNTQHITLEKTDWQVPDNYPVSDKTRLTPLKAGETLHWKLKESVA
ncbi:dihydroorotase [Bathymodiolus japonicus methanotrophic gill symbiont]|uniref:dihydroorotase n=1 Tax=Bathymodiolus japonicus methanotrophic gill symbiont TaxID=113269 RepID=UPI001B52735E|nr:dihydroorotase [Bathymodiolus japonicus methanotrophic gill symbiont]GFO70955.1 dihydroorotase [Bathymodiolus japonicus methanotrophic gill symbiont]